MSYFSHIRRFFSVNWTTVLVGWTGLGVFSPWPDRWIEFPTLLSIGEIQLYAEERILSKPDASEERLIIDILILDNSVENRESVRILLKKLSDFDCGNELLEQKKWRLVMIEHVLDNIPSDVVYALVSLSEFWQEFGFPPGSPHEIQGRKNNMSASNYYTQENYDKIINNHRIWIEEEKKMIINLDSK